MSRYINADKLEKDGWSIQRIRQASLTEMVYETKKPTDYPAADVQEVVKEWCNERNCIIVAREDFPRLEVRHGKWIDPEDPTCYKCSVCGEYATQEYGLTEPIFWRYCPNCGANMDLEE